MVKSKRTFKIFNFSTIALSTVLLSTYFVSELSSSNNALSSPSFFEYRWDGPRNYRKLYYTQSSKDKRDRATYYLVMKAKDRRTGILKLSISIPDYFNTYITPRKLKLCKVSVGGMLERTRCVEDIPAIFEVSKKQTKIEVFPDQPIPASKDSYAVVMKIFNPDQPGMFQLNATGQSPGDMPISSYIGSWSIDID